MSQGQITIVCLGMTGTTVASPEQSPAPGETAPPGISPPGILPSVTAPSRTALPGAAETMLALRAAGIGVCLTTSMPPPARDALLDKLGWQPLIDLALSECEAARGLPWPDLPLTAMLRLGGTSVAELAVAGDAPADVLAGRRAGAGLVAGVLTGAAGEDELAAAGAAYVLDSIAGLLPLLGIGPAQPRG